MSSSTPSDAEKAFREALWSLSLLQDFRTYSNGDIRKLIDEAVRLFSLDRQALEEEVAHLRDALVAVEGDRGAQAEAMQALEEALSQAKAERDEAHEQLSEVILEAAYSGAPILMRCTPDLPQVVRGLVDRVNEAEREAADLKAENERLKVEAAMAHARTAVAPLVAKELETERTPDSIRLGAMDQGQTFTWMAEELQRLRERLAVLESERDEARAGYVKLEESCCALNLVALGRAQRVWALELAAARVASDIDAVIERSNVEVWTGEGWRASMGIQRDRLRAALLSDPSTPPTAGACFESPCVVCKTPVGTCEVGKCPDGKPEHEAGVQLRDDVSWVCSERCFEIAADRPTPSTEQEEQ